MGNFRSTKAARFRHVGRSGVGVERFLRGVGWQLPPGEGKGKLGRVWCGGCGGPLVVGPGRFTGVCGVCEGEEEE